MDYLERVLGYDFPKSAEIVLDKLQIKTPIIIEKQEKDRVKSLILPEKNNNNDQAIEYLKSRGIDEEIIEKLLEKC